MADDAAAQLAKYLTDRSGYEHRSPLDKMLELRITEMANDIAREVVAATPDLESVIRRQVVDLMRKALAEDAYMSRIVISAVASALHSVVVDSA